VSRNTRSWPARPEVLASHKGASAVRIMYYRRTKAGRCSATWNSRAVPPLPSSAPPPRAANRPDPRALPLQLALAPSLPRSLAPSLSLSLSLAPCYPLERPAHRTFSRSCPSRRLVWLHFSHLFFVYRRLRHWPRLENIQSYAHRLHAVTVHVPTSIARILRGLLLRSRNLPRIITIIFDFSYRSGDRGIPVYASQLQLLIRRNCA
jgi:hypothetical protein